MICPSAQTITFVRATGIELQEIPQLNYNMEYVTTHLQEIPQRIR